MSDDIEAMMAQASEQQRYGKTPTGSDDEDNTDNPVQKQNQDGPERRYIDNRWLCYYGDDKFVQYVDNEWKPVPAEENIEDLKQKWELLGPTQQSSSSQPAKCIVNGVKMIWNAVGQTWIPDVEVNEDFLASYHSQYGVNTDYSSIKVPEPKKSTEVPLTKNEKRAKKREAAAAEAERLKGWVQMDDQSNNKIYISGLPKTITEEEYIEMLSKYGLIMEEPRTGKPKVKLYRDNEGNLKGDGICCYAKVESVYLALQLLDELRYDDEHTIHVERAKFEMKGAFDPKKKKARLSVAQKKKFFEKQNKALEWKPDLPRNYRPPNERTVVLKNMFTLEEIDANAALILDIKEDVKERYSRFGKIKTVVVYDTNPEGVVTITYESHEFSDIAVKSIDGVIRNGRQIQASLWDGKEKFKRQETEEERARRNNAWEEFLGAQEEEQEEE